MALDPKELKKLADACRKAGIKSYKSGDVEFTLTDEPPPVSAYKKRKAFKTSPEASNSPEDGLIEADGWDTLSEEQKLFYSARDPLFENEGEKQ